MVAAEARRKRNRRREEEALRSLDVTAQARAPAAQAAAPMGDEMQPQTTLYDEG